MIRRITLKEIANELNVSISTVSKSLKDSHEIETFNSFAISFSVIRLIILTILKTNC